MYLCKCFTNRNGKSTCESWCKESKMQQDCLSCWWLNQPLRKICSSKWVHLPQFLGMKITKKIEVSPARMVFEYSKRWERLMWRPCCRFFHPRSCWARSLQRCLFFFGSGLPSLKLTFSHLKMGCLEYDRFLLGGRTVSLKWDRFLLKQHLFFKKSRRFLEYPKFWVP